MRLCSDTGPGDPAFALSGSADGIARHLSRWQLAILFLGCLGCESAKKPPPGPTGERGAAPTAQVDALSPRLRKAAPPRLVAIGDLHGDYDAMMRALSLAGAVDAQGQWSGGDLVVVQTGDQIDRGDDDRRILDALDRLEAEAKRAGGALVVLNGNHEFMNVALDFRYVTEGALRAFDDLTTQPTTQPHASHPLLDKVPTAARGRATAFVAGGPYAKLLAKREFVVQFGDSVFVHGGILPKHLDYGIDKLSDEVRKWLVGESPTPPPAILAEDAPVWTRLYSAAPSKEECETLSKALTRLSAKRMVMGHTVQRGGISSACGDKAWRIDVGLSHYYQGPVEVLEIRGDSVRVLKGT